MNYVGFAFVLIAAVATHWIPESPKFLMMQCRFTEARLILDKIAEVNGRPVF